MPKAKLVRVGRVGRALYRGGFLNRAAFVTLILLGVLPPLPALGITPPPAKSPLPPSLFDEDYNGHDAEAVAQLRALMRAQQKESDEERPLTPEEQEAAAYLEKHLGGEVSRDTASVLRALFELHRRRQSASEKAPSKEEKAARLRWQFVAGDWDALKGFMASVPQKIAPHVYVALLEVLSAAPVLPEDVLKLADLAPSELTERQLMMLGRMLSQAVRQLGTPQVMLARLHNGTLRLGGQDAAHRLAAARLLLHAELPLPAGEYLPPIDGVLKSGDPELLNLHASHQETLAKKAKQADALPRAWLLTRTLLERSKANESQYREALERATRLFSLLPQPFVADWLGATFRERPDLSLRLLEQIAQRIETAWKNGEIPPRLEAHRVRHVALQALWAEGREQAERKVAIGLFLLAWHRDAQYTLERRAATPVPDRQPQLPAEGLLQVAPEDAWCDAIAPDAGRAVRRFTARLAVQAVDQPRLLPIVAKTHPYDPDLADELAGDFLKAWAQKLRSTARESQAALDNTRYIFSHGLPMYSGAAHGQGIPLTRAKQERNLDQLATLLDAFRAARVRQFDQDAVAEAFDACHSPAEVYREEDVRKIFGDPQTLSAEAASALASKMREHLASQWRRPEVQEQQSTNRTDPELVAEVERGYRLAANWLQQAVERFRRRDDLQNLLATVYFDHAEFLYGQKVDLEVYASLRERAFATYRRAAESYALSFPQLGPDEYAVDVYLQWFRSALGASDLAYLSRQDQPERDQIDQIAAAIGELGPKPAERHFELLAGKISSSAQEVPPQLKPRYFREALRILGGRAAAKPLREIVQLYDELVREVELHVALDGGTEVGHQQPFGVHLMIRSTKALARESQGFAALLTAGGTPHSATDDRQKLEREIRDKWGQAFQVECIRFHEPTVTARRFGRPDWEQTPLAYLVLRATDASVDRLPGLQLDLEFNDGQGTFLLPVTSQVALIDARDPRPAPRPCRDIEVKQVLDDRRLAEGLLRLEITAAGKGLLPGLDHLLDISPAAFSGLRVKNIQDHGLDIGTLDAAGPEVQASCARSWVMELELDRDAAVRQFAFPRPQLAAAVSFLRYSDADLVEATEVVSLPLGLRGQAGWLAWAAGGTLLTGAFAAGIAVALRRRGRQVRAPRYRPPAELSPFNLLSLLQRIKDDPAVSLEASERTALDETIVRLEQRFFTSAGSSDDAADLSELLDPWLRRANASGNK